MWLYLLIIVVGFAIAMRSIFDEFRKENKPHLQIGPSATDQKPVRPAPAEPVPSAVQVTPVTSEIPKAQRIELVLKEKNALIKRLETQIANERLHRVQFDKVKSILDSYINDLRVQNTQYNHEMGEAKLREDDYLKAINGLKDLLHEKDQLINQYQSKMEELRIRSQVADNKSFVSEDFSIYPTSRRFTAIP